MVSFYSYEFGIQYFIGQSGNAAPLADFPVSQQWRAEISSPLIHQNSGVTVQQESSANASHAPVGNIMLIFEL